jgi:hypothetical protein
LLYRKLTEYWKTYFKSCVWQYQRAPGEDLLPFLSRIPWPEPKPWESLLDLFIWFIEQLIDAHAAELLVAFDPRTSSLDFILELRSNVIPEVLRREIDSDESAWYRVFGESRVGIDGPGWRCDPYTLHYLDQGIHKVDPKTSFEPLILHWQAEAAKKLAVPNTPGANIASPTSAKPFSEDLSTAEGRRRLVNRICAKNGWSLDDFHEQGGGPDRKTVDRWIEGSRITNKSRQAIANALKIKSEYLQE